MAHTLLLWILVGLLVGWMLTFAFLACRPGPGREKTSEYELSAIQPVAQKPAVTPQAPVRVMTKLQALTEDIGISK